MKKNKKNPDNIKVEKKLLKLFSTFYPKFYILENLLKRKITQKLQDQVGENWFDQVKQQSKLFIEEAELITRRKQKNFKINQSLFLHEASFGFWIELFGRENYKQLKGIPIKAFEKLPGDIKRNDLYRMLSNIKEVRNNLYHHRINISHQLTLKEIKSFRQTEKDLILIIRSLDSESLKIIDSSKFFKKHQ